MRRVAILLVAAFALSSITTADAAPQGNKSSAARRAKKKKKSKHPPWFKGANVPKSEYRTDPLERPSGQLWLRNINLDEEVRVNIYKPDGSFDDAALAKLDELFRCQRSGEIRAVRAELYEQLSRIHDHFGKRIDVSSGFRYPERTSSRHHHASAADFRIEGVSIYEIRKFAATLDTGNMGLGIYPNSQFVHLDYRAPGEPSFRWTDYSGPDGGKKSSKSKSKKSKKKTGRTQPARKPVS